MFVPSNFSAANLNVIDITTGPVDAFLEIRVHSRP